MTRNKVHMGNSSQSERVRCGLLKKNAFWKLYGVISGVTCKSCLRFYNSDLAEEMEASA